jgi:hypothetical protein
MRQITSTQPGQGMPGRFASLSHVAAAGVSTPFLRQQVQILIATRHDLIDYSQGAARAGPMGQAQPHLAAAAPALRLGACSYGHRGPYGRQGGQNRCCGAAREPRVHSKRQRPGGHWCSFAVRTLAAAEDCRQTCLVVFCIRVASESLVVLDLALVSSV